MQREVRPFVPEHGVPSSGRRPPRRVGRHHQRVLVRDRDARTPVWESATRERRQGGLVRSQVRDGLPGQARRKRGKPRLAQEEREHHTGL